MQLKSHLTVLGGCSTLPGVLVWYVCTVTVVVCLVFTTVRFPIGAEPIRAFMSDYMQLLIKQVVSISHPKL